MAWIRANELPTGGIRGHSRLAIGYPEVTGYLVPTLLQYGERPLATRLLRWLLRVQRADGAFTSPKGVPYVFDTGQALRGLLAAAGILPGALTAAQRAADYLCQQMIDGGRGGFGPRYSQSVPEAIHLYLLPPLYRAADVLGNPQYRLAADRCLDYYSRTGDALKIGDLTHWLGYELEALIDLGHAEKAIAVLDALRNLQQRDGSVRGRAGVEWTCSPGLAQLAVCWYKVGWWESGDKALASLEAHQQPSGGFLGSYGPGASYLPHVELSWAVKFYLDAHFLRMKSLLSRNDQVQPSSLSREDDLLRAVLPMINPDDRVLEIGWERESLLEALHDLYPQVDCFRLDCSPGLLARLPSGINPVRGLAASMPFRDGGFAVVFALEVVRRFPEPETVVAEMIRIGRPGAWIIVIDKQLPRTRPSRRVPWEELPKKGRLREVLIQSCSHVAVEPVATRRDSPDAGRLTVWRGRKKDEKKVIL